MKTLKRVPVQLVRVCYGLDEVCSADQFRPMVALLKMAGNGSAAMRRELRSGVGRMPHRCMLVAVLFGFEVNR